MNKEYLWKKLGNTIQQALDDASVTEIMRNADENLWVQRSKKSIEVEGAMSAHQAMALAQAVAQYAGFYLNESNPTLVCSLPFNNARVSICIPPITSSVAFNIRKHSLHVMSLQDYENDSILSKSQTQYLKNSISGKKNILVSGGPGSGKTTLTNALLKQVAEEMPHGHRVLILENTHELQCHVANHLCMRTSENRSMRYLIQQALLSAPKAIVVGEVVDGAVLDLLKAWNVGCPGGLATIHANSAKASLQRLEDLALEVVVTPPQNLIGEAVDVIVHIAADRKHPAGRVVTDMIEVVWFDKGESNYVISHIQ